MKRVLFQGDSITDAGRGECTLGSGYVMLIASKLGLTNPTEFEFINRGVGGDRSVDMLARWRKDCIGFEPDYVSFMIGINDIWHEIDFKNGVSAERYELFLTMMIEDMKQQLPNTKIIIMEPYVTHGTATDPQWDYFRSEVDKRIELVNKLAEKYHLPCVHLQKCFDDAVKKAPAENWTKEGVHATPAGNEVIKNAWLKVFNGGQL